MSTDHDTPSVKTRGQQYEDLRHGQTGSQMDFTCGDYETEKDAERALDEALERSGCFRVYKQVTGFHIQPRLGQDQLKPRVDRLLLPLNHLVAGGWAHGAVAIECKRTMEKIGRPISQMIDYGRSAFYLPGSRVAVIPSYVFLFPYGGCGGPLESVFSQQHLGMLFINWRGGLVFRAGHDCLGIIGPNEGQYEVNETNHGNKAGSR